MLEENYAKARIELGNASQLKPEDAGIRVLLGEVSEAEGDLVLAYSLYHAAVERAPENPEALAALARMMILGDRPQQAIESMDPGFDADPRNPALLVARASAREMLGNFDGALQDVRRALSRDPGNIRALSVQASVLQRQRRTDEAIDLLQGALQKNKDQAELRAILANLYEFAKRDAEAERELLWLVNTRSRSLIYRYRLSRFFLIHDKPGKAEEVLRDAVRLAPDNIEPKLRLVSLIGARQGKERALQEINRFIAATPKDAAMRLGFAHYLGDLGLRSEGQTLLRETMETAVREVDARAARAELALQLLDSGQMAEVQNLLAGYMDNSVQDVPLLLARARYLTNVARPRAAIGDLRLALKLEPNSVPAMRALAGAYAGAGLPDLAEDMLHDALQRAPADLEVRISLAQLLNSIGRFAQASRVLTDISQEYPADLRLQDALFVAYAGNKEWDAARAVAAAIRTTWPDQAIGHLRMGDVEDATQKADAAEMSFRRAVELGPDDDATIGALARFYVKQGQHAKVRKLLDDEIRRKPDRGFTYLLLGEFQSTIGDLPGGIAAYRKATGLMPGSAIAWRGLALSELAAGNTFEAVRALQDGVNKSAQSIPLAAELAAILEQSGHIDDAISTYEWIIKRFPDNAGLVNNLAMLLVTHKTDAVSLARASTLVDSISGLSGAGFLDTAGWVKYKAGHATEALPLLIQAVDRAPGVPEIHYHLGMTLYARGDFAGAKQHLKQSLKGKANFFGADEAHRTLAAIEGKPN